MNKYIYVWVCLICFVTGKLKGCTPILVGPNSRVSSALASYNFHCPIFRSQG